MVTEKDVQFLENHLAENPDSILFARLADAYLQLDKVDDAIKVCEDGIKKYPYYATGHYVLGKSYLAKKLYEQAEKEFKRVLLFDPKFLAAHKNYGDLMKEIGWENTCETSYKKILQIDPLDEVARKMVKEFEAKNQEAAQQSSMPEELKPEPVAEKAEAEELYPASPQKETPEEAQPLEDSLPVSAIEDDLIFEDDEGVEAPPETGKTETATAPPQAEESLPELDDEKEEEFSYLLDDIFKDEVVENNEHKPNSIVDEPLDRDSSEESIVKVDELDEPTQNVITENHIEQDLQHAVTQKKTQPTDVDTSVGEVDIPQSEDELPTPLSTDESENNHNETAQERNTPAEFPEPFEKLEPPPIEDELKKSKKSGTRKRKGGEKIVTPTLGEIYTAQGQYAKAIDVFETLLKKYPDNEFYLKKIENLKQKLSESQNASES